MAIRVVHGAYLAVAVLAPLAVLGCVALDAPPTLSRAARLVQRLTFAWAVLQLGLDVPCPLTELERSLSGLAPAETFLPPLGASPALAVGAGAYFALSVTALLVGFTHSQPAHQEHQC